MLWVPELAPWMKTAVAKVLPSALEPRSQLETGSESTSVTSSILLVITTLRFESGDEPEFALDGEQSEYCAGSDGGI